MAAFLWAVVPAASEWQAMDLWTRIGGLTAAILIGAAVFGGVLLATGMRLHHLARPAAARRES